MSERQCPVLLAGMLAGNPDDTTAFDKAYCIGGHCAWWNARYNFCMIEMIALRA